jgi:alpha-ketoglutarate-dependent taurine dioxygenase
MIKTQTYPCIIQPQSESQKSNPVDFVEDSLEMITANLREHGAVLLRGFNIDNAQVFEDVIRIVEPDLKNNYLGTSPRNKVTDFVFTASELPNYYPIMQHCEMSFLPVAPRRLFFYCKTEPLSEGETPLCDFKAVAEKMNPKIKSDFEKKGIRNIRNYEAPGTNSKLNLWQLKPWNELFMTTNKQEVEKIAKDIQLNLEWGEKDSLKLVNEQSAFRTHPDTGDQIWFNHLQVFHRNAASLEYKKIKSFRPNLRNQKYNLVTQLMTLIKSFKKGSEMPLHVTYADGSEIPNSHLEHIVDLIWENLAVVPWEKRDALIIDNFRISHGRLPYTGPREILVSWSS